MTSAASTVSESGSSFQILRTDKLGVVCRWTNFKPLNSYLYKKTKNVDYRWVMDPDNKFSCIIYYSMLPGLTSLLEQHGFDTNPLKNIGMPSDMEENERKASGKHIIVIGKTDDGGVWCQWGYNADIQNILKQYTKGSDYRWRKDEDSFSCLLNPSILQDFLNRADEADVNVSELETASGLRSTAFDVPEVELPKPEYPLREDISKNIPFALREYQMDDVRKMLSLRRVLNANEMGCGKTIESVIVGECFPFPKLVICPATLRLNWAKEIRMCNPGADIKILLSADEFETGKDWTIVGYSSLVKHKPGLVKSRFNAVFIDEAHYVKAIAANGFPGSDRAAATLEICARARYVYPITGTPKTGHNKDLFNIMRLIRHPIAQSRKDFGSFADRFCDPQQAPFGYTVNGNINDRILFRELKPYMIRHLKAEVLSDITKVRSFVPAEVNLNSYDKIMDEFLLLRIAEGKTEALELVLLGKLKKTLAAMKVANTIDYCRNFIDQNEKVVIVTCYTEVIEQIMDAFKNNAVKLVGGMTDTEKDSSIEQFQKTGIQVFAMNVVAGGVGITLTSSHIMVFNDFDWNPVNLIQAEDRIARSGQKFVSDIYYMYADGAEIDEYIAGILDSKLDSISRTVDGGKTGDIDIKNMVLDALRRERSSSY